MLEESPKDSEGSVQRVALTVSGIVQGVGFRPFIHGLARKLGLAGYVKNIGASVLIEVEGIEGVITGFMRELRIAAPPMARIDRVDQELRSPLGEKGFAIQSSIAHEAGEILISPDTATCTECLSELRNPTDRRYGYPFLNCMHCGPRLTIIESMPYDRERTTLKGFRLCPDCRREYEDARDRRFHAQPIACAVCGPALRIVDSKGRALLGPDPIGQGAVLLRGGKILALKGLGGFHLACNALTEATVRELRKRKHRDEKPFAIMVADLDQARRFCELSERDVSVLTSRESPIVLLKKRPGCGIAPDVSGSSPFLGVMLPYTPLHALLLERAGSVPLVMTSGNASDHPMIREEQDALERLGPIADALLVHDRPIRVRCDDSLVRVLPAISAPVLIRRSRGYAPTPIPLNAAGRVPILAVGALLKNTFALTHGKQAILSHHIGDLDELSTYDAFRSEIAHYEALFRVRPQALAHDLHPDYLSSRYAQGRAARDRIPIVAVQHHHAHLASCMVDNALDGSKQVIGVTFDGAGYGTDSKIWGGEFLIGNYESFERAAHLAYVPMPGGDRAAREPWRMATAYLLAAGVDPSLISMPKDQLRALHRMIELGLNSPETSSVGRLFDAVAAILGLRTHASFEGQAAMELEALAMQNAPDGIYPVHLKGTGDGSPIVIELAPWIRMIVEERNRGCPGPEIASRFHASMIDLIARVCSRLRARREINQVALSGGVFMNGILLSGAFTRLQEEGFQVYCHRQVPSNDGGISLGQLAVAAAVLNRGENHVSGDPGEAH